MNVNPMNNELIRVDEISVEPRLPVGNQRSQNATQHGTNSEVISVIGENKNSLIPSYVSFFFLLNHHYK